MAHTLELWIIICYLKFVQRKSMIFSNNLIFCCKSLSTYHCSGLYSSWQACRSGKVCTNINIELYSGYPHLKHLPMKFQPKWRSATRVHQNRRSKLRQGYTHIETSCKFCEGQMKTSGSSWVLYVCCNTHEPYFLRLSALHVRLY